MSDSASGLLLASAAANGSPGQEASYTVQKLRVIQVLALGQGLRGIVRWRVVRGRSRVRGRGVWVVLGLDVTLGLRAD